jgi:hypothetical protein
MPLVRCYLASYSSDSLQSLKTAAIVKEIYSVLDFLSYINVCITVLSFQLPIEKNHAVVKNVFLSQVWNSSSLITASQEKCMKLCTHGTQFFLIFLYRNMSKIQKVFLQKGREGSRSNKVNKLCRHQSKM